MKKREPLIFTRILFDSNLKKKNNQADGQQRCHPHFYGLSESFVALENSTTIAIRRSKLSKE